MTLIEGTASLVLRHTSGDAFDVAGGIVRTFGSNLYKEQSAHEIKLFIRERKRFKAVRKGMNACRRRRATEMISQVSLNPIHSLA